MTLQATDTAPLTGTAATRLWADWLTMWNSDPAIASDIIGPGYRVHLPQVGATVDTGQIRDAEGMSAWVRGFRARFENLRYRTDFGPIVDGDRFACRWYGTATYTGRTGWPRDVPGQPVLMVGVDIFRVVGGLIVECWTQGAET